MTSAIVTLGPVRKGPTTMLSATGSLLANISAPTVAASGLCLKRPICDRLPCRAQFVEVVKERERRRSSLRARRVRRGPDFTQERERTAQALPPRCA
jgi:hypothetical protein